MKRLITSFLIGLCGLAATAHAQPPAAGTVVMATGPATASSPSGEIRPLQKGDAVFSGETLHTAAGSFLNVRFEDGSYTLLRPESRLQIEAFAYQAPSPAPPPAVLPRATPSPLALAPAQTPAPDRAYLRLLKGGFRAVTGAIGRLNTEDYRITTPVATIGIRGTQPFVQLVDDEESPLVDRLGLPPGMQTAGGAVIGNFEGEIIVQPHPRGAAPGPGDERRAQVLVAGQFMFVDAQGRSVPIPMPGFARETPDPRSPDCN